MLKLLAKQPNERNKLAEVKRRRRTASTKPKTKVSRGRERIEDTESNRNKVAKSAKHRGTTVDGGIVMGENGLPAIEIVHQGSELVPVAQYANVTIGPVSVKRYVEDPGLYKITGIDPDDYDEEQQAIATAYKENLVVGQSLLEEVIAEDREAVEISVKRQNADKDKK